MYSSYIHVYICDFIEQSVIFIQMSEECSL